MIFQKIMTKKNCFWTNLMKWLIFCFTSWVSMLQWVRFYCYINQSKLFLFIESVCFLTVLFYLTKIYCKIAGKNVITFMTMWKTITMSSFGTFLLLPSLIWDRKAQELHLCVVSLYTTMAQLLGYTGTIIYWVFQIISTSYIFVLFL